jgi:tRNA(adenine34) deaminase
MRPPAPLPLGSEQLWMERLLRMAQWAGEAGEIPVAAVVLDGAGRALGWGTNRRQARQDPLGHAELVALSQAARLIRDWRFNACSLLVTLEPCPMCAGALIQARMGRVVFAAGDAKRGALGGCLNLAEDPSAHHHMEVMGGVREQEARELLESWFRDRRRAQAIAATGADCRKAGSSVSSRLSSRSTFSGWLL